MVEAGNAHKVDENFVVQRDRRADGGARRIRVTRSDVLISRFLRGVAMMIAVPVSAYRGVVLDVLASEDGLPRYVLSLTHRDPDLDILLAETRDGGSVAADWKHWAAWLGLPRLAGEDGETSPLDGALGAVDAGAPLGRRRDVNVSKRRPRFLTRRKGGETRRAGVVFAGEREIICYE